MTDSTPRLPDTFAGSISEGTLNTRHLVPRYCEVISYVWPTHPTVERYSVLGAALDIIGQFTGDEAKDVADLLGVWECSAMQELCNDMFDALNDIAPEGTYFSSSEGDGASFGFWAIECELCGHPSLSHTRSDDGERCVECDCEGYDNA